MQISSLFVCLMGMGVTFIGLTTLIFLIWLMGRLLGRKRAPAQPAPVSTVTGPNSGELIAVLSAVIAEEMGTEVSALRIVELKKLS